MMKFLIAAGVAVGLSAPVLADGHEIPEETAAKIMAMLEEMKCQMDPDDIEVEDGGYELDDVICEGGNQFDIELDAELNEPGRRAE